MVSLDTLQKLADTQRNEKSKLEGKIESLMEELSENGCSSIREAKNIVKDNTTKLAEMEKTYKTNLTKFEENHASEIQNIS